MDKQDGYETDIDKSQPLDTFWKSERENLLKINEEHRILNGQLREEITQKDREINKIATDNAIWVLRNNGTIAEFRCHIKELEKQIAGYQLHRGKGES